MNSSGFSNGSSVQQTANSQQRVAEFLHYEVGDGIDLYLLPTTRFKTVTIKTYLYRPLDERTTAASLLLQVMRRGCRKYPTTRKILTFLEDCYGASLNMATIKIGERQALYFKLEAIADRYLPRGRNIDRLLVFLREMITHPLVKDDVVEQEKRNLRNSIDGLINDRMEYAYERLLQSMCEGEPYARYELGRSEELGPIAPKELSDVHAGTLRAAPIVAMAAGDFDPDAFARKLERMLEIPKRAHAPLPPVVQRDAPAEPREIRDERDVEQAKLVIGCRTGTTLADDRYYPLMVYSALLGAFPHSRLFVNVREKEGLAYYAHSMVEGSKGLMLISAGIDFAAYEKCLPVIRAQMDDLCAGNIGDDEWDKTMRSLHDRIDKWNDDPSARMGAFAEMRLNGVARTPQQVHERLASLTRDEVAKAGHAVRWDTVYFLTRGGS